jgi:general secretion pathway protein D
MANPDRDAMVNEQGVQRVRRRVAAFGSALVIATMLAPASAQVVRGPRTPIPLITGNPGAPPATAAVAPPVTPPPPPPATPGIATAPAASGAASGKKPGDTGNLPQFKDEIEFEPRPAGYKVQFSLEDADLPELIKVMGQLTGKRFIFGGKVRNIKATIYSPQKVTVAEAYQAFLAILETNGLTVIPHGKFLKIVESPGVVTQATPIYGPGQANAAEDRYITRLHRLQYVTADEVANVLTHFKSRDGDITIYSPGNLLIITDTGTNIKRMMQIVEEIDVAGIGDQIWVEPIHYSGAQEIATKLNEIFDVNKGAAAAPGGARGPGSQAIESRVTKIIPEERTNSIVVIGTEKAYLRILELIKRLDVPMTGEGEIHVLPLQHADAEELAKTLTDITGGKGGVPQGPKVPGQPSTTTVFEGTIRITADKSTNSLVITSSLRDYASLRNVIDRLDQARRQVFIEAVIMEVSTDHTNKLGVSFHGGDNVSSVGPDGSVILGGSNALGSVGFPNITDPSSLQGLALGVRSNTLLTLAGIGISVPAFGVSLQAVTTSGDTNVLSTPHIMATDNVVAEINVGENVPLQSSLLGSVAGIGGLPGAAGATAGLGGLGGAPFGSAFGGISRQNVGTKLKLTPHINDSNEVRLEIDEEISELGAAQRITQRNVKTQVVIQDQQTIVIGGLVRDFVSNDETKIPVLGDIPIIGALFKQTSRRNQKRNLLLILTPYVIRDPADLRAIFERKMEERQEFLDRYFVFAGDSKEWKPYVDYTRTRGLVEEIRQAYMREEEKAALEEQTRPKEVKKHEASKPISELPPSPGAGGSYANTGGAVAPPTPLPMPGPITAPPGIVRPQPPIARAVTIEN